jgi:dimethylargininase
VFVEDALVCYDGVALLTRSGAPSRRGESEGLKAFLDQHGHALGLHRVAEMQAPAQMDGGDLLAVGDGLFFVGSSTRTNAQGQQRLAEVFPARRVVPVPVPSASLHLKSLITYAGKDVGYIYHASPQGEAVLRSCQAEAPAPATAVPDLIAANVLRVAQTVFYNPGPRSQAIFDRLQVAHPHLQFQALAMPTFALADGALTCCSVLICS